MNNSVWNVTSNSNLDTLALSHSTVDFASHASTAGTFTTLNVENLSGNSTFIMRADVVGEGNGVNNKGDLLNISGSSAGNHVLAIRNQGSEATTGNEVLTVVKTTDGAASFSASSQVELGDICTMCVKMALTGSFTLPGQFRNRLLILNQHRLPLSLP